VEKKKDKLEGRGRGKKTKSEGGKRGERTLSKGRRRERRIGKESSGAGRIRK
jgi:hypothetical protein